MLSWGFATEGVCERAALRLSGSPLQAYGDQCSTGPPHLVLRPRHSQLEWQLIATEFARKSIVNFLSWSLVDLLLAASQSPVVI